MIVVETLQESRAAIYIRDITGRRISIVKRGVQAVRDYLTYIHAEGRKRYYATLTARDAVHDIALGNYDAWGDAERIAINVASLYREFSGDTTPPNVAHLFAPMGEIWKERRG